MQRIKVSALLLDPENPRLPRAMRGTDDQIQLATYIAKRYRAIEIARSIASNGFFESEALIAVEQGSDFVVMEGNRRLTALKGLTDASFRDAYPRSKEWSSLAAEVESRDLVPADVPVVVAADADEVWPIIGYRHVSGIEPWDAFAKAQFIADRVGENADWDEIADLVGESVTSVRSHYRNFMIAEQARNQFKIDVSRVENEFGIFTRAMSSVPIRNHIGAPGPGDVQRGKKPLAARKKPDVAELVGWLYGENGTDPVIAESRQLSELASVLQSKRSTTVLRETRSLLEAYLVSPGQKEDLVKRLTRAEAILRTSLDEVRGRRGDEEIIALVNASATQARALKAALASKSSTKKKSAKD